MERLTIDDLILKLNDEGLPKSEAERILLIVLDAMKTSVAAGDEVYLKGFGKFVPTYRPEKHRNIFGNIRKVPERRSVKFRPFTAFIKSMNS